MPSKGPSKLFHAIVGLGLIAAACGGRNDMPEGDAAQSMSEEPAPDALAADAGPDRATTGGADASLAAEAAADVASDVAREAWHPIPIV